MIGYVTGSTLGEPGDNGLCPCGRPFANCGAQEDEVCLDENDTAAFLGSLFEIGQMREIGKIQNRQSLIGILAEINTTLSVVANTAQLVTEIIDDELQSDRTN